MPPWLARALSGGPWPAFHPPVVGAVPQLLEDARRQPGLDRRVLDEVGRWVEQRLPLVADDVPALVHGDLEERGLDEGSLVDVPRWLRGAYPDLFGREELRDRLDLYDVLGELALGAHHPEPEVRATAQRRTVLALEGRNHLEGLSW